MLRRRKLWGAMQCGALILFAVLIRGTYVGAQSSILPPANPISSTLDISRKPASGAVPFVFTGNRIYSQLSFVRPDGSLRKVLAFVDMGSPSPILSPALFKDLHIDKGAPLSFRIGKLTITADASTVTNDSWFPFSIGNNRTVEALLPAGVLQKYVTVIDYRRRILTLAQPGAIHPEGDPVPFSTNQKTGLIAVNISVNGSSYPVTVDNGSAYTWIKMEIVRHWLTVHPKWVRGTGAVGLSNMRMEDDGIEANGTVVRIAEITLGRVRIQNVGALAVGMSKSKSDLIDWYSAKNPYPVIGWLGGNVLSSFKITLDYPNNLSYWLKQSELDPHDLDQVGITLISKGHQYYVATVVTQGGKQTVDDVQVGDKLLQVNNLKTNAATWGEIFKAMHGKPGDIRTLLLERNGKRFTVSAAVKAF